MFGHLEIESGSGGRCPLTIAAAFDHIDFESGSDSKSSMLRSGTKFPSFRALRRRGGGLRAYYFVAGGRWRNLVRGNARSFAAHMNSVRGIQIPHPFSVSAGAIAFFDCAGGFL